MESDEPEQAKTLRDKLLNMPDTISISIETGVLVFSVLRLCDEESLWSLVEERLLPRQFVIGLLSHQLQEPKDAPLDKMNDQELMYVLSKWLSADGYLVEQHTANDPNELFGEVMESAKKHVEERKALYSSLARTFAPKIKSPTIVPYGMDLTVGVKVATSALNAAAGFTAMASAASAVSKAAKVHLNFTAGLSAATSGVEQHIAGIKATSASLARVGQIGLPKVGNPILLGNAVVPRDLLGSIAPQIMHSVGAASRQLKETIMGMDALYSHVAEISRTGAAISRLTEQFRVGMILPSLPDLTILIREVEQEKQEKAWDAAGFGFIIGLIAASFMEGLESVAPEVLNATATNRLLKWTKQPEFTNEIRRVMSEINVKRWRIVEAALKAHIERKYILSIPVLLAQTEGVLSDLLCLRGEAIVIDKKLYARDASGASKLNKKNKPILLDSIARKLEHSALKKHELLDATAKTLTDVIAPWRNDVLHGADMNYGQANQSVRLLMILRLMLLELAGLVVAKE